METNDSFTAIIQLRKNVTCLFHPRIPLTAISNAKRHPQTHFILNSVATTSKSNFEAAILTPRASGIISRRRSGPTKNTRATLAVYFLPHFPPVGQSTFFYPEIRIASLWAIQNIDLKHIREILSHDLAVAARFSGLPRNFHAKHSGKRKHRFMTLRSIWTKR